MNLGRFVWIYQIVGAYQRTVGNNLRGTELLFTQEGTTQTVQVVAIIGIGGNLHEVEGNLAKLELLAPLFYQQLQTFRVLVARIADVRAALIEQNALHGIVKDGIERAVTPYQGAVVVPLFLEIDNTHSVCRFIGVLLQILLRQPTFHTTATLIGFDESDGNIQCLMHHTGKEVTRCRKLVNSLWRTVAPLRLCILLRFHTHDAGNLGTSYATVMSSINDYLVVILHRTHTKPLDGHLHIRLTGTDPYFAREYIINSDQSVTIVESNAQRGIRGLW